MQEVSGSIPLGSTIFQNFQNSDLCFNPRLTGTITGIRHNSHIIDFATLYIKIYLDSTEWYGRTDMKYSILTIKLGLRIFFLNM